MIRLFNENVLTMSDATTTMAINDDPIVVVFGLFVTLVAFLSLS